MSRLCVCGHEEKEHGKLDEHACYWSEGSGKNYRDCECSAFEPAALDEEVWVCTKKESELVERYLALRADVVRGEVAVRDVRSQMELFG